MGKIMEVRRTVRVPIERPNDATWKKLRDTSFMASRFGNRMLARQYAKKLGWTSVEGDLRGEYKDDNDKLGGEVRKAIQNETLWIWTRSGRNILAGRDRLARFSADRALRLPADPNNRGAIFLRTGDDYVIACAIEPKKVAERIRLRVWLQSTRIQKDSYIREAIERIWQGVWRPRTVALVFDQRKHSIDALISCLMPLHVAPTGERSATIGPILDGRLWLRFEHGPSVELTDCVREAEDKKQHFSGIQQRLRRRAGRHAGWRQGYRKKLRELGSFEDWSRNWMHQLSRRIVAACRTHGASSLSFIDLQGDLPWFRVREQCSYKGQEFGLVVSKAEAPDIKQPDGRRAGQAMIRRDDRKIKKARAGVRAIEELLADSATARK